MSVCCTSMPLIWSPDLPNFIYVLMDHLNRAGCLSHHKYEKSMYSDGMLMLQVFLTVVRVTLQPVSCQDSLFLEWKMVVKYFIFISIENIRCIHFVININISWNYLCNECSVVISSHLIIQCCTWNRESIVCCSGCNF